MASIGKKTTMITSVKDLQNSLLEKSKKFDDPMFKRDFLMTSPGCPTERIEELKGVLPGLPDSYIKWVSRVNLNGISVGYFGISPCSNYKGDMVESLIKGNEDSMYSPVNELYKLYSIGTRDGFEVSIATKNSPGFQEGEIILIDEEMLSDIHNPRKGDIAKLAKDFEQFLIAAGNLNQIHREIRDDNSNWEEKKQEFIERLKILGVSEEYHSAWFSVF